MSNTVEKIKINGTTVTGYSDYYLINEIIYTEEPERSLDFSMPTISSIPRGIIPHLYLSFNYLTIEKYQELLRLTSPAEFAITYTDIEDGTEKTKYFYMKPAQRATLYTVAKERKAYVNGVRDLTIEFVATMNLMSRVNVTYDLNLGSSGNISATAVGGQTVYRGDQVKVASISYDSSTHVFDGWSRNPNATGGEYQPDRSITVNDNITLYAVWITGSTHKYNLFFSYGRAVIDNTTTLSTLVEYDTACGELPSVNDREEDGTPYVIGYSFDGWYALPNPDEYTKKYTSETTYDVSGDKVVYANYIPKTYTISFNANNTNATLKNAQDRSVTFGENYGTLPVVTPPAGYEFVGWNTQSDGKGTMITENSIVTIAGNHTLWLIIRSV